MSEPTQLTPGQHRGRRHVGSRVRRWGRFTRRCKVRNWWRRARFSRTTSWTARVIGDPIRWRRQGQWCRPEPHSQSGHQVVRFL